MSNDVDHATDAEVIDYDDAKARNTLRKVEAAIAKWIGSTVDLADLCHEAQREQCWRVDDDYRAALAAGAIAPAVGGSGGAEQARTWLGWKFNRSPRAARDLADYGEVRAILAADRTLPQLAEPEYAARRMVAKLLHVKLRGSEQPDIEAHHAAIREAWRIATTRTERDVHAAVDEVLRPVVLKQLEYKPLRRLAEAKPPGQKAEERKALIVRSVKDLRDAGYKLIELGAVDRFDAVIAELAEARARWTPT
jgi:hypothetical protein